MGRILTIFVFAVVLSGCRSQPLEQARVGSLSERVGGHDGVDKIVDHFTTVAPQSEELKQQFANLDLDRFRANLSGYLCAKIGASCANASAQQALQDDLSLTSEQYGTFMELFIVSMNEANLPQKEQNDLLDAVMQLESGIVKQ